jgi:hypothetical protein
MRRKYTRYTKELLEPIVKRNVTMAGVMRDLGVRFAGGTHEHIRKVIDRFGLDTSHFTGKCSFEPGTHTWYRRTPAEVLIITDNFYRTPGWKLRRALLEIGIPDKCGHCGLESSWNGKPLVLTPNHKDGNSKDNRSENLELLCPNCHSQTETFAGRNKSFQGVA